MPTYRICLFALVVLFSAACSKDETAEDTRLPPSITISSDIAAGSTACIDQEVPLEFTFNAPKIIQSLPVRLLFHELTD